MFGEHADFIIPAYAITGVSLIGMTVYIWLSHRARKKELRELEEAGISRRSAEKN